VLALDATSYITLVSNPFKNVVVFPTTATNRPTGVPLVAISQSTATVTYYSWAQTRGLCSLYMGATYTIGSAFGVDDTAGQGLTKAADGTFVWGTVLHIGAAAEAPSIVHLTID